MPHQGQPQSSPLLLQAASSTLAGKKGAEVPNFRACCSRSVGLNPYKFLGPGHRMEGASQRFRPAHKSTRAPRVARESRTAAAIRELRPLKYC